VLNSSNTAAGTIARTNTTNTALTIQSSKQYISHLNASSNRTWTFNWTAPATGSGTLSFYTVGNFTNNSGDNTADVIHSHTFSITEAAGAPACTPNGTPAAEGTFSPTEANFPCINKGVFFDEVLYFKNFTAVVVPGFGTVNVDSLKFNNLNNLPCNISWQSNKASNTYASGENGCIRIFGTTNDNTGQYTVDPNVTVYTGFGPITSNGSATALA
jgi:hypothetical protein